MISIERPSSSSNKEVKRPKSAPSRTSPKMNVFHPMDPITMGLAQSSMVNLTEKIVEKILLLKVPNIRPGSSQNFDPNKKYYVSFSIKSKNR